LQSKKKSGAKKKDKVLAGWPAGASPLCPYPGKNAGKKRIQQKKKAAKKRKKTGTFQKRNKK
jgi:hypothetical protein